jgi:hypothetical protein
VPKRNSLEQVLAKTKASANGCLEYQGRIAKDGYGQASYLHRPWVVHRLVYFFLHGPLPDELVVRHKCDNRKCVRPEHLVLGTHKDNSRDMNERGRNAFSNRTHCKRGHPYDDENTYRTKDGRRNCKACWKIYKRKAK